MVIVNRLDKCPGKTKNFPTTPRRLIFPRRNQTPQNFSPLSTTGSQIKPTTLLVSPTSPTCISTIPISFYPRILRIPQPTIERTIDATCVTSRDTEHADRHRRPTRLSPTTVDTHAHLHN